MVSKMFLKGVLNSASEDLQIKKKNESLSAIVFELLNDYSVNTPPLHTPDVYVGQAKRAAPGHL